MKRPTFLTVMLVWVFLSSLYSLYSYFLKGTLLVVLLNVPSWVPTAFALCSGLNLLSVVLLWNWRKVGFYIILGSALMVITLNLMFMSLRGLGVIIAVLTLIVVGLLYLAMRPVWSRFNRGPRD